MKQCGQGAEIVQYFYAQNISL